MQDTISVHRSESLSPRNSVESIPKDNPTQQSAGRVRKARACDECNRKKIKCDKSLPWCSLCIRTGRECSYPRKRRRPTKPWLSRLSFEAEDGEKVNQILDRLDPIVLEEALMRRGERPSIQEPTSPQSNSAILSDVTTTRNERPEPTPSDEMEVAMVATSTELRPIEPQHETIFLEDSFDPRLGSWLNDSSFDASGLDALDESLGDFQDLSFLRVQDFSMSVSQSFPFGFFPSATPGFAGQTSTDGKPVEYAMSIPAPVVDDTIDVFFKDIAGWLPLFHRPRFYRKFHVGDQDPERYSHLSLEDCLILNSMCALAARFSIAPYFAETPLKCRAEPFLSYAAQLFQDSMKLDTAIGPSLSLLQGILLLGWYHQVCGSSGRCGSLISISCRLAYELRLNNIDQLILETKAATQWTSVEEWSRKEELRRTWWLIWELDMFSSSILQRPHTIDKLHINVLLPVSDEVWFADTPVPSVAVIPDPVQVWKTLNDSPNKDDRAWFLVASFIHAFAHDITSRRQTTAQMLSDFQAGMTCFSLSLPKRFQLSASCLSFDDNTFSGSNWIVCSHLILLSARNLLRLCIHRKFPELSDISFSISTLEDQRVVCRVIREWDPNYIARACPLVSATLLGPSALNAKTACQQAANPEESRPMYLEMLKLVLGVIGVFWQIGTSVSDLVQLLEARRPLTDLVNSRKTDIDRLPLLHPKNDDEEAST